MSTELCYLCATEAIEKFKAKILSPVELMEAVIARAEAVESKVNAFCFTFYDEAMDKAKQAEDAYMNGTARPLEGLPVSIKDEHMIAGQPMTNGCLPLKDYVADYTDVVPQRLMDAGGIVHARTTTPELSMTFVTWSKLWGVTRNPWNLDLGVGGSSGGSGCSLAAGTSMLASGSDIGGSVRIPAAMNGVVGFKPPKGRIPGGAPWNRDTYETSGPLARCMDDLVLMQNIISGPHPYDMFSLPRLKLPADPGSIKGMRIAMSVDFGFMRVEPEIRKALNDAADIFRSLGAVVEPVDLGWDAKLTQVGYAHLTFLASELMRGIFPEMPPMDQFTSYIQQFLQDNEATSLGGEIAGWMYTDEMYQKMQDAVFLAGFDALICPTLTTTNMPADFDHSQDILVVDGQKVDRFDFVMTLAFNMLGTMPVVNIPIGQAVNNVPIGMQVVGPAMQDDVAFKVAKAFETIRPLPYSQKVFPLVN
jgi:Asp-tRNA(Asn)/Glu-tRNA(Gln) amidotransferase A subunit family amidase